MPKPKPPVKPPQRPAPLWQRAIERFHAPFDARNTNDYTSTISDWAELPAAERQGHGMHLLFRVAGGIADVAHNLREIRVLLATELPAIRRRLGELESLVDEHGSAIVAGGGPNVGVGDDDEEDEDGEEGDDEALDTESGGLESDEDLDAEFERQQAARKPAPRPQPSAKPEPESVVPDAIISAPAKPQRPRKKPAVVDGSAS